MGKVRKFLIWTFFLGLFLGITGIVSFLIYMETSIDKIMSKERQEWLYAQINNSPQLPESFYETMTKYYPDYFDKGVWGTIINRFTGRKTTGCTCSEIYIRPGHTDYWTPFSQYIIALEFEERFSTKKCFDYDMSTTNFGHNTRNITQAAKLFYNKELSELNEREILELHIIKKAPTLYSPFNNKENLNKAVENIIKKN